MMSANYEEANQIKEIWRPLFDKTINAQELAYLITLARDETARLIANHTENISIQSRIDTYLDCANEGSGSPILRAYARRRAEQLKAQLKENTDG